MVRRTSRGDGNHLDPPVLTFRMPKHILLNRDRPSNGGLVPQNRLVQSSSPLPSQNQGIQFQPSRSDSVVRAQKNAPQPLQLSHSFDRSINQAAPVPTPPDPPATPTAQQPRSPPSAPLPRPPARPRKLLWLQGLRGRLRGRLSTVASITAQQAKTRTRKGSRQEWS
jgi:hypothetical protein